jgi:glycosyltransferase involved in cell wall biosynthesis
MTGNLLCRQKFDELNACVIIPTYNNETTLEKVIRDVSEYTSHIIVINDGSTDNTKAIIDSFSTIQKVEYTKNVGKGWALRQSFKYAIEKGYKYAISIDSDGQHFAKDLPTFINKLETEKNAIIIGARNMDQASVPGGSNFGNKVSNFWFRVETGINLPDTQSGYRLYPLEPIKTMNFITRKYEFEIEVMVRSAWAGVTVLPVPVSVYYPAKGERISHFRPYKDFIRIGILNSILVLIAFLYIKPRDFFRSIFIKKNFRQTLKAHLHNPHHTPLLKATSVAFGVFMGIIPIWGFQLMAAIFLAIVLKLNKPLVIVAANISVPPMVPVIIFGSYKAGSFWMGSKAITFDFSKTITLESIKNNLQQYIWGSITLAVIAAIFFGLISYVIIKLLDRKKSKAL